MIRNYRRHAANERTFLAWLRTAIAVIAFGFVIEKFNLFALTMATAISVDPLRKAQLDRFSGSVGQGVGHSFVLVGIVFIVVATFRFVHTGWLLNDQTMHSPNIVADLSLSIVLAVLLLIVSSLLFFG
jgi:putative membrane protein